MLSPDSVPRSSPVTLNKSVEGITRSSFLCRLPRVFLVNSSHKISTLFFKLWYLRFFYDQHLELLIEKTKKNTTTKIMRCWKCTRRCPIMNVTVPSCPNTSSATSRSYGIVWNNADRTHPVLRTQQMHAIPSSEAPSIVWDCRYHNPAGCVMRCRLQTVPWEPGPLQC